MKINSLYEKVGIWERRGDIIFVFGKLVIDLRCRQVWKDSHPVDIDNAVTCQIKQLRKKLGNNPKETPYIETVWGVGYKFNHGMD